jgi:alanine racemase
MIPQSGTLLISAARLGHNVSIFRRRLPAKVKISATVKANAYGHSLETLAPWFKKSGIDWLCVYSLFEAAQLLALDSKLPILVLAPLVIRPGPPPLDGTLLHTLKSQLVRVTLTDADSARELAAFAAKKKFPRPLKIHVQIDTGLTRHGVGADEAKKLIFEIGRMPALKLEGVFMHLSHGETPDHRATAAQLAEFKKLTGQARAKNPKLIRHAQNSGGAWNAGDVGLDIVRLGIGIYGLQPSMDHPIENLLPIARLVAPIAAIHQRPAGVGVGYGHTFITKRRSRLAVVPVGYADGYPRHLSNQSFAQFGGALLPVLGRVSMDQIVVDVTDSAAQVGDIVTLVSDDPTSPICMDRLAQRCGTIGYELATRLGPRLVRKVID